MHLPLAQPIGQRNGGNNPFFMVTRMMPPEVSVFQFLPSAFFFSSSVSSSHQPSFFSSTWSNSGYPVVRSLPFGCEPSAASSETPSRSTPKLARKQPPPSIIATDVL